MAPTKCNLVDLASYILAKSAFKETGNRPINGYTLLGESIWFPFSFVTSRVVYGAGEECWYSKKLTFSHLHCELLAFLIGCCLFATYQIQLLKFKKKVRQFDKLARRTSRRLPVKVFRSTKRFEVERLKQIVCRPQKCLNVWLSGKLKRL